MKTTIYLLSGKIIKTNKPFITFVNDEYDDFLIINKSETAIDVVLIGKDDVPAELYNKYPDGTMGIKPEIKYGWVRNQYDKIFG